MATTNQSAAQQVFRLPELLETILLCLPQKDLLLSQRVSRSFRETTQGSIRLQRALFLAPDWNLEGRTFSPCAFHNRPGRKPENNRLLLRAFPGCYPTVTLVIVNDGTPPSREDLELGRSGGSEHWSWDVCISFPADHAPDTRPAVLHPEASWRRMYLSQPPCTSLHLVRRWKRCPTPAIVSEGGITMGAFVDAATKSHVAEGTVPSTSGEDRSARVVDGVEVEVGERWHKSFISSDRDWHFEGNIRCSALDLEDELESEDDV